jgi:hypothetical protein
MSASDKVLDKLQSDIISLIGKAKSNLNTPPTIPGLSDDFSTNYSLNDGQTSPDGKWRCLYKSGGVVESKNGLLHMAPRVVTAADQTASCLLLSTKSFKNFQLDFNMRTNKQLRTGSPPNAWETAWVMGRFTDEQPKSNHHYYFVLKTNGYEFGKKDNAPGDTGLEQQIFLNTGPSPAARMGQSVKVTIIAKDFHFTIKINDVVVVDTDNLPKDPEKMAQGLIGLYTEDADVSFDNVKLVEI